MYLILPVPVVFRLMAFTLQLSVLKNILRLTLVLRRSKKSAKNYCQTARTIPIYLTTKYTESNLIVNHEQPTTNVCNSVTGQTAHKKYTDMGMSNTTTNFIHLI
jgi:hypothetical protein